MKHLREGRLNPYSGKWNFGQGMLFDLKPEERGPVEDRLVAELMGELTHILVEGPVDTLRCGQRTASNPHHEASGVEGFASFCLSLKEEMGDD